MPNQPDIWIKGGLICPKHCGAIGPALWLYLYILQIVAFESGDHGEAGSTTRYSHVDASTYLGGSLRNVKYWFGRLVKGGYIEARRRQYGVDVKVTKYVPPAVRARQQRERAKERPGPADSEVQTAALLIPPADSEVQTEVQTEVQNLALSSLYTKDQEINIADDVSGPNPNGKIAGLPGTEVESAARTVEAHFTGKRNRGISLSPTDYMKISEVLDDGIPLSTILAGIDATFEGFRPQFKGHEIRTFGYCVPRIREMHARNVAGAIRKTTTRREKGDRDGGVNRRDSESNGQKQGSTDRFALSRQLLRERGELS